MSKDISCRAGWLVKAFHTFFDYWTGSAMSMSKSGKVMYGWNLNKLGDNFMGGSPPNLDDITVEKIKLEKFMQSLLGHSKLPRDIKRILLANGLRFYDDFVQLVMKEPRGKFSTMEKLKEHHFFVRNVSEML
jgi:hypothetical protein